MTGSGKVGEWVFLTYALPRNPSAPRLALWRRLKRLGVAQLADGLVALPADSRTREQLEWAADEVVGNGGRAGVWLAQPATRAQEREIKESMNTARAAEYDVVIADAREALQRPDVERTRALRRLREENRRIRRRDFFRPAQRETARRLLDELAASVATADAVTTVDTEVSP
ncbi:MULTISPECIES: Chromate resistance protein ChrB [unclassified Nocardioides]|uniref:Chromate resistance protein ChrB n=1 Tax=unclassified Nocardioides TaxID=2615069 RepID=UPI001EE3D938|nr:MULTISPECIES: Chromate resistance protein ChrB [unclassified Nocardioides]